MTTQSISILNQSTMLDVGVYPSRLDAELALTNAKIQTCILMPAPSGADIGFSTEIQVPENYASAPVIRLWGIIDGTPANVFGVGVQLLERAASDSVDTAYEAEDLANNSTWTGYADEDYYFIDITLTPSAALTPGRVLLLKVFRDDSVDTQTINFLLMDALFRYTTT